MINNKCTKLAAAMGLTLFAGLAQAAIVELTTNGNFETGDTSGWTTFLSTNQSFTTSSTSPYAGSFNGILSNTQIGTAAVIKQAAIGKGLVTPFQEVTISFYARGSGEVGGVQFAELFSEVDPEGVSKSEILGGAPLFPPSATDWTFYTFTRELGPDVSNGLTLQFNAATGAAGGSTSFLEIDNVSVTADVSAVPVPAAVWLFGSGLLGLVGMARRKKAQAA